MALDYQQVRQQVKEMGAMAPQRELRIREQRLRAQQYLQEQADRLAALRQKVEIARGYDPTLRCAIPADETLGRAEALNARFGLPELTAAATVLAADGSQIIPDRHAEALYGLINIGAIQMRLGSPEPPAITVESQLIYPGMQAADDDDLPGEDALALQRDLSERRMMVDLAREAERPVVAFTDGPLELWGAKDAGDSADFKRSLDLYLEALQSLYGLGVTSAGYVDKPAANLVVRLLEVGLTPLDELANIKDKHPLRGVSDKYLYEGLLDPGERSAVFAIQSKSAANYKGEVALHFFYLNVGRIGHPHLARVEIPRWVAGDPERADLLQAVLVSQCRLMGSKPYPYLLHRAHESAVVRLDEKEEVTQMIMLELRSRGVEVDEGSYKQANKDLASRTRYRG